MGFSPSVQRVCPPLGTSGFSQAEVALSPMNIEEYPDVASLSDNSVDEFVPIETRIDVQSLGRA